MQLHQDCFRLSVDEIKKRNNKNHEKQIINCINIINVFKY